MLIFTQLVFSSLHNQPKGEADMKIKFESLAPSRFLIELIIFGIIEFIRDMKNAFFSPRFMRSVKLLAIAVLAVIATYYFFQFVDVGNQLHNEINELNQGYSIK